MKIDWGKVITSKTVWANVIVLVLALADILSANPLVPPSTAIYITGLVIPILNVFLRFLTNDSLITKKPPVP